MDVCSFICALKGCSGFPGCTNTGGKGVRVMREDNPATEAKEILEPSPVSSRSLRRSGRPSGVGLARRCSPLAFVGAHVGLGDLLGPCVPRR
jgi:hypothetical protein